MMQCPRCGFDQPIDKYCASCGLDVEAYQARPKPMWYRLWNNPSFYGIIVGALLIFAAFYIFTNQRALGRHVGSLFKNPFLLSKQAADPNAEETPVVREEPHVAAAAAVEDPTDAAVPTAAKEPTYTQMEIGFFELSRENSIAFRAGRTVREEGDWRVIYFEDSKTIDTLKSAATKLPGGQEKTLQKETVEIDAGDLNPDLQSPYLAVSADWTKNETLHWAIDVQLPAQSLNEGNPRAVASDQTTDLAANSPGPEAAGAGGPPPLHLTTMEGALPFKPPAALLMIYTPAARVPTRPGDHARFSTSPLNVLTSDDFRSGYTDLIVWIKFH
jgi:hypothetical protein